MNNVENKAILFNDVDKELVSGLQTGRSVKNDWNIGDTYYTVQGYAIKHGYFEEGSFFPLKANLWGDTKYCDKIIRISSNTISAIVELKDGRYPVYETHDGYSIDDGGYIVTRYGMIDGLIFETYRDALYFVKIIAE